MARRDARRRAPLPAAGRGEALRRRGRALRAQPAAPAPQRRPGLADRDPLVAAAGGGRRRDRGRRRAGGFYSQARVRRAGRVRGGAGDRRRPRDRPAGPRERGAVAYPELAPRRVRREAVHRHRRRLQHARRRRASACTSSSTTSCASWRSSRPVRTCTSAATRCSRSRAEEYVGSSSARARSSRSHGKQPIGWEEIARTRLDPGTIVQHWKDPELAARAAAQGARVIMSPASRTYFDHKYDETTKLGTQWAGHIGVRDAYDWDPATRSASRPRSGRRRSRRWRPRVHGVPAAARARRGRVDAAARPRLGGLPRAPRGRRAASSTCSASTTSAHPTEGVGRREGRRPHLRSGQWTTCTESLPASAFGPSAAPSSSPSVSPAANPALRVSK